MQWLFIRMMGVVYLIAFTSLLGQIRGLWGKNGIIPITILLNIYRSYHKRPYRYYHLPTLFWLYSSDVGLICTAVLGQICSLLVFFDLATLPMLILCWVFWLSFLCAGGIFLQFQWDALLSEMGFCTIIFAILTPPPVMVVLLLWVVLFKFMVMAGIAKILSGDPSWRDGTALSYHYETQPIPNRISWWMHQLPLNFHKACTYGSLAVEIVVPFLIFSSDSIRLFVCIVFIFLQITIFITGNFAYFNVLAAVMAFPLLNDDYLGNWTPTPTGEPVFLLKFTVTFLSVCLIAWNFISLINLFLQRGIFPFLEKLYPFRICNHYGLFAVMTKERNEIIIEGSQDEIEWKTYEFYWKPGELSRAPGQVAPMQPRLDWQMWFAALSQFRSQTWFMCLLEHLLKGTPEVVSLLKTDPFKGSPPKYIRATYYKYNFTTREEKKQTGHWWKRTFIGYYSPICTLKEREEERRDLGI
jgi:hypothetical protein